MTQYDTAFRTQCQRLAEAQSPLEGRAKAFWFLRKAGLSEDLRRQVVSTAGGIYDYAKLRSALVAIVPHVGVADHGSGEDRRGHHGDFRRGRSPGPRSSHKVHAVVEGEDDGRDEADSKMSDGDYDGDCGADDLELEAEVLLTAAARRRAEHSKNRGFHRSESPQAREKRIESMKQRMACAACRANGKLVYGHWHSDPACPYYGKSDGKGGSKQSGTKSVFVVTQEKDDEDTLSDDSDAAFLSHVILMSSSEKLRKASALMALSDTCCARTVAGEKWCKNVLEKLHEFGTAFYIIQDNQPFRFGDGPKVWAKYALVMPVQIKNARCPFLLRISVVQDDVPLLLSAKVLQQLGTVLDMGGQEYVFKALEASIKMKSTGTGHIGFELFSDHPDPTDLLRIDWEAFLETGEEVVFIERLEDCSTGHVFTLDPGPVHETRVKHVSFCDDVEWFRYEVGEDDDICVSAVVDPLSEAETDQPSPICERDGVHYHRSSQEAQRVGECLGEHDVYVSSGTGGDGGGEAESDLQECEAGQASSSAHSQLEEVQHGPVVRQDAPEMLPSDVMFYFLWFWRCFCVFFICLCHVISCLFF